MAGGSEVGHWDAWGDTHDGLEHANAVCVMTTPEEAVARVMEKARQKYRVTDWSRWRFHAVEFGQQGPRRTLLFRVDDGGRPIRLGE
jgi:hypothetical protein